MPGADEVRLLPRLRIPLRPVLPALTKQRIAYLKKIPRHGPTEKPAAPRVLYRRTTRGVVIISFQPAHPVANLYFRRLPLRPARLELRMNKFSGLCVVHPVILPAKRVGKNARPTFATH
jgi:hypothetical protein